MLLPYPKKTFKAVTKRNWQEFFDACSSVRDDRIQWIRSLAESTGLVRPEDLDLSPKSLVPLWRAVSPMVKWEQSPSYSRIQVEDKPEWFYSEFDSISKPCGGDEIIPESGYDLLSIWMLDGLSHYFGEVFCHFSEDFVWEKSQNNNPSKVMNGYLPHIKNTARQYFYFCPHGPVSTALGIATGLTATKNRESILFDYCMNLLSSCDRAQ